MSLSFQKSRRATASLTVLHYQDHRSMFILMQKTAFVKMQYFDIHHSEFAVFSFDRCYYFLPWREIIFNSIHDQIENHETNKSFSQLVF